MYWWRLAHGGVSLWALVANDQFPSAVWGIAEARSLDPALHTDVRSISCRAAEPKAPRLSALEHGASQGRAAVLTRQDNHILECFSSRQRLEWPSASVSHTHTACERTELYSDMREKEPGNRETIRLSERREHRAAIESPGEILLQQTWNERRCRQRAGLWDIPEVSRRVGLVYSAWTTSCRGRQATCSREAASGGRFTWPRPWASPGSQQEITNRLTGAQGRSRGDEHQALTAPGPASCRRPVRRSWASSKPRSCGAWRQWRLNPGANFRAKERWRWMWKKQKKQPVKHHVLVVGRSEGRSHVWC